MPVFRKQPAVPGNRGADRPRARSFSSRSISASTPPHVRLTQSPPLPLGYTPAMAAPFATPRSITAAAVAININDKGEVERFKERRSSGADAWQQEAWEYFDAIGEVKYAFSMVASVISRIRLFAGYVADSSQAPTPVAQVNAEDDERTKRLFAAATRAIDHLDSAIGGQAGLLRDAALNLSVSGECYLVRVPARPGSGAPESWDIRSINEVVTDARGKMVITPRRDSMNTTAGQREVIALPDKAFVGRIWRAHPRYTGEADSSMRGILDLCAELLLLDRAFRAAERSRMNAGALYVPDTIGVSSGPDADPFAAELDADPEAVEAPQESEDDFEEQLMKAMTTPIRDEDSASAVVPMLIRGPAEMADKVKYITFERKFDAVMASRADRVLERIMQGIDVPKDAITGLANVKYANAIQIDESLYKAHIEPLMLLIVDALNVIYLKPSLRASGFTDAEIERVCVWYDPSQVATRNDRAVDADSGFEKMAISFASWRRAHGFSEDDAPDATETALRMLINTGSFTPELTEAMLSAVAPDVMKKVRDAAQASSAAPVPPEVEQLLNSGATQPAEEQLQPGETDESLIGEEPPAE